MKNKKGVCMFTTVNLGSFSGSCLFSCGYPYKDLVRDIKKQKCGDWIKDLKKHKSFLEKESAGSAIKSVSKINGNKITFYYICLKDPWTSSDEDYVTLAHEVLHICQQRLKDILDRDEEVECEAYTHSHIMSQILNAIKPFKNGN